MLSTVSMSGHQQHHHRSSPPSVSGGPSNEGLGALWTSHDAVGNGSAYDPHYLSKEFESMSFGDDYDEVMHGHGGGYPSGSAPANGHLLSQNFHRQSSSGGMRGNNNITECVKVPSSEHVAEIVGRQGCKIKALRAKTGTYIKTPVRGEEPVFVVTGKPTDVEHAKREIQTAAEHFTNIRASRSQQRSTMTNGGGGGGGGAQAAMRPSDGASSRPADHITLQVKVPYSVVGLVVGPRGATIKKIQSMTSTYIVTPSREKDPVFEIQGTRENAMKAKNEISGYISQRTSPRYQEEGGMPYFNEGEDLQQRAAEEFYYQDGRGSSLDNVVNSIAKSNPSDIWSPAQSDWSGMSRTSVSAYSSFALAEGGAAGGRRGSAEPRQNAFKFDESSGSHVPLSHTRSEPNHTRSQARFQPFSRDSSAFSSTNSLGCSSPMTPSTGTGFFGSLFGAIGQPSFGEIGSAGASSTSAMSDSGVSGVSASDNGLSAQSRSSPPNAGGLPSAAAAGGKTPNGRECAVCKKPRETDYALVPCGHSSFCEECAFGFAEKKQECPACDPKVVVRSVLRLRNQ